MPNTYRSLPIDSLVCLNLRPGVAPLRSYVGQVYTSDKHGVRVRLGDVDSRQFDGFDLFVPWSHITSALVCTEHHERNDFFEWATIWHDQMKGLGIGP